jgi:hypothetical protein
MSLAGSVVAGNDVRALKQRKEQSKKHVLPLTEEEVTKAKACEEMIMYEHASATSPKNEVIAHVQLVLR